MNNGLSKISVTAYGRVVGAYSAEMTYAIYSIVIEEELYEYFVPQYIVKWVTKQGDSPNPDFLDELIDRDSIYIITDKGAGAPFLGGRNFKLEFSPSSNFGFYQEQVMTMRISPIIQL